MATKRERDGDGQVAELEPVVPAAPDDISNNPKMVIVAGRGKVGKSVCLRWLLERYIGRGGEPVIADGDRTNATLAAFFPSAIRPPSAEDEDVRLWLNELVDQQIENNSTVYLDLGGGDLTLKQWSRDLDLATFLERYGVTPVLLHLLSSDLDDLAYLRDLETVFAPAHTAIVLNEGMVPPGRSALSAFEPIMGHSVFLATRNRGARILRMPRLGCMQDIDRRRMSFAAAEAGEVVPGHPKIGPTMRQMVFMWQAEMEKSFAGVAPWIA
jgi:hypothetical protein